MNQAMSALKVGFPWYKADKRGQCLRFLWWEEEFEESFTEAYKQYEEWAETIVYAKDGKVEEKEELAGGAGDAKPKAKGKKGRKAAELTAMLPVPKRTRAAAAARPSMSTPSLLAWQKQRRSKVCTQRWQAARLRSRKTSRGIEIGGGRRKRRWQIH